MVLLRPLCLGFPFFPVFHEAFSIMKLLTFHVDPALTNLSDLMISSCASPFFHEINSSEIPYQCF